MKTYRSPVYPALMVRLPGEGRRNVKAVGGVFNVPDADVKAFEEFVASRPHYRIEQEDGARVASPNAITDSERHPENVQAPTPDNMSKDDLVAALRARGVPSSGNRAALVQRLKDAIAGGEEAGSEDDEGADEGDQDDDEEDLGSPDGSDDDDDADDDGDDEDADESEE